MLNSGVPEAFLYYLGVDTLLEEQRGVAVSEIVKPDAWHASTLRDAGEVPLGHVVRVQRSPVGLAEDQAVVLVGLPELAAASVLACLHRAKSTNYNNGVSGNCGQMVLWVIFVARGRSRLPVFHLLCSWGHAILWPRYLRPFSRLPWTWSTPLWTTAFFTW
jgi:hypothetical protein